MTDSSTSSQSPRERLIYVPLAELTPGPNAPKAAGAPPELVESVRTYGILQPLLARPGGEGYEVIAGFKRLSAAREAGLSEIPVRVYRAEDPSLKGLYTATNVFSRGRSKVAPPPASDFGSAGALGGLLDEELNKTPGEAPYRFIILAATVILLLIWGGVHLTSTWFSGSDDPEVLATPTPERMAGGGSGNMPTPTPLADTSSIEQARAVLSGVDGIEIRNAAGFPRIVFREAVFSSLLTIDPDQTGRLESVVNRVHAADPRATLSIIGHTDNDPVRPNGTYRDNDHLGQLRADAVKAYLSESTDIPESQLLTNSSGSTDAPFPNTPGAGKAKNRTVTIEIVFRNR